MGTRPLRAPKPDPRCALDMSQVYSVVARFGVTQWLAAHEVAEYCQARYTDLTGITTARVTTLLGALTSRRRISTWQAADEQRWAMPTTEIPEAPHD